jgi:predicted DNA-binding protein (MmcQ/YjbR family)
VKKGIAGQCLQIRGDFIIANIYPKKESRGNHVKEQLRDLLKRKPGAQEKYIEDWQAYNYTVGGKMFAILGTDKNNEPILSLKCDPHEAELLRNQYADIQPGYYLNKKHWNSIYYMNETVPMTFIEELIESSYRLVFQSLTKKLQAELQQS